MLANDSSTEMADLPLHLNLFRDNYLPEPLTYDSNPFETYYLNERGGPVTYYPNLHLTYYLSERERDGYSSIGGLTRRASFEPSCLVFAVE